MGLRLKRWLDELDAAHGVPSADELAARVHQVLGRRFGGRPVMVQPTDERLALFVGALLHDSGRASRTSPTRMWLPSARQ